MGIFGGRSEDEGRASAVEELGRRISLAALPGHARDQAQRELGLLSRISSNSAEYAIGLNYINYILGLRWTSHTEDILDLSLARQILDSRYYGLASVKERALEHLAVMILKGAAKPRALVVDDEDAARKNLSHILDREGYAVSSASGGAEALALIDQGSFDVVLTDMRMQGTGGMDILKAALIKRPQTKVILITGYGSIDSAVESIRQGAFHYITKPYKVDEVRSIVRDALHAGRRLSPTGPVLCFAGPPGTGKTSIGKAIAEAMGRKFGRISLGGVHDEADIRGHRRTYAGAQPGRIMEEIRKLQCVNPVLMLDEIDKLGAEMKGDPASALLEVLDPEQNTQFLDHYLDVPFDLSSVLFIATANVPDRIPGPLRDRMEIVEFTGYTEREKLRIGLDYLGPKQVEQQGIAHLSPSFTPEAMLAIIRQHTREAGIRELERQVSSICRRVALRSVQSKPQEGAADVTIDERMVREILGPRKYYLEEAGTSRVGVATGLVRTDSGGEIVFIECARMKGDKELNLTGSLGAVMRESAHTALSYVRSNASRLGISEDFFEGHDIHMHVPAGAVPKDGPSAGATMVVALVSLLTGRPARGDAGITGEITLGGDMLPVAGVKEKLLAARRAGLRLVILPAKNSVEVDSLPAEIKEGIEIRLVENIVDALAQLLLD